MLVRRIILALAFLLGAGVTMLSRLPTESSCRAAGYDLDPEGHYCVGVAGRMELREHVLDRALDPVVFIPAVLAVAIGLTAAARRDRRGPGNPPEGGREPA